MTQEEFQELKMQDKYLKERKKNEEWEIRLWLNEVNYQCPLCGKDVIRYKYNYGCSGYKEGCNFRIFMSMSGRTISVNNAKQLLENGRTDLLHGFTSRSGKSFDASIKLEGDKCVFDFGG